MTEQYTPSTDIAGNQRSTEPDPPPPNLPGSRSSSLRTLGRWALLGGLLFAGLGASFAPWVHRPSAALVLTAPDLAEFVKFLPEVQDGSLKVYRLLFLLPLLVATLSLPLIVAAHRPGYPRWVRWPVTVIAIPFSLTLLPPVWSPGVLLAGEFRLQTIACLICLGLVVVSRWLGDLPGRPLVILLAPSLLVALALALWQFRVARGAIARAYASPIVPGWGAWAVLIGSLLLILGALLAARDG